MITKAYIYNKVKALGALLTMPLLFASCVDTIILPDNLTVDEDFWKSKDDVSQMVNGAYRSMLSENVMSRLIVWGGLRGDEFVPVEAVTGALVEDLVEINLANTQEDNQFAEWSGIYSVINNCNIVLDRAEAVMAEDPSYTQGDYLADRSQMLALRALCYFYLVRNVRDVPYITESYMNSSKERYVPQTNPDSVLTCCINDLKEAERNALSATTFNDWKRVGYFTRDGIQALLADIYLWRGSVEHNVADYQACIDYCDRVIASKRAQHRPGRDEVVAKDYPLEDGERMFIELFVSQNAEESIFELQMDGASNGASALCKYFNALSASDTRHYLYAPTIFTYGGDVFTSSSSVDWRGAESTYYGNTSVSVGESTVLEIRKFVSNDYMPLTSITTAPAAKARAFSANYAQNYPVYRLSDVMLMKAEALVAIASGDDTDTESLQKAFHLVNAVNKRAKTADALTAGDTLKATTFASSATTMENLILAERLREFAFEGKRWYDLLRFNYRHVEGVDYKSTLYEQSERNGWAPVANYGPMLNLMKRKLSTKGDAVAAKIGDETKLYMPIPLRDLNITPVLHQNPGYNSTETISKN